MTKPSHIERYRWAWLFPLAYGFHIVEEYWFHFPAYVASVSGHHIPDAHFLLINVVLWLVMVAAVVVVLMRPSQAWLLVTLAAILGVNAALHIAGSVVTATYSPGTVTAAALFVPLVVYSLRQLLPRMGRGLAVRAAVLGAAIHAGVSFLAANLGG